MTRKAGATAAPVKPKAVPLDEDMPQPARPPQRPPHMGRDEL